MEGQQPAPRTQKGLKKASQPHHVLPKGETGYTDNAAEECHDLIDRAEEEAHLHEPGSMYSTETSHPEPVHRAQPGGGGLEGASSTGGGATGMMHETGQSMKSTGAGATEKAHEKGKGMKHAIGEKMEHVKEKMGMNK